MAAQDQKPVGTMLLGGCLDLEVNMSWRRVIIVGCNLKACFAP